MKDFEKWDKQTINYNFDIYLKEDEQDKEILMCYIPFANSYFNVPSGGGYEKLLKKSHAFIESKLKEINQRNN